MTSKNIDGDYEGFGIVYLEANLHNLPVIAGDSGGVSDAVSDNFSGLLVDPNDIKDISQTITKLAKDSDLRNKLGGQGRLRVINEFNWKNLAQKFYDIVRL
jgi:phosphatidylinositol alpha-1,6-mannosyltransferase